MKYYFQKIIMIALSIVCLIACSSDGDSNLTYDDITSLTSEKNVVIDREIEPLRIIYEEGITKREVITIRDSFKRDPFINLQFYSECDEIEFSSVVEIWYVDIDYEGDGRGPGTKDPIDHIESNSGVSKVYMNIDSCYDK